MDASPPENYLRRGNRNNMEDIDDKSRSLSELPENVLSHILSFLPTKQAVRTSILSKRWEYIWTSIPKLRFFEGNELPMDFVNIVNRSLQLRGSFDLTSFFIRCDINDFSIRCDELGIDIDIISQIEVWLSDVVRFSVQNVKLNLSCHTSLTLPLNFVNCRTLTSLSIDLFDAFLELPSSVCLSNLKKLELCNVMFPDEHSTQKLFSGCPVLEDLKLEWCNWEYVKAVSVVSPMLQHFTMIEDNEITEQNFNGFEFVIFGGGLKYFHYEGEFQFDFNILNPLLLEKVHINFYSPIDGPILVINHFLKLLRQTYNVPNLRLVNALCLLDIPEVVIHMPKFIGVRHLELNYESSDLSNLGLLMTLQNMPCLESITFLEGINMPSDPIEDNILYPVPSCFFNHLYFICIFVRKGDVNDLIGVKVLLKNAWVLEELAIEFSKLVTKDTRNNFCIELLKLPRASRDCGIYIWK